MEMALHHTTKSRRRGCSGSRKTREMRMGQFSLGAMHVEGMGVAKDLGEAARLFRLAADQGNADAQNRLGQMHRKDVPEPDAGAQKAQARKHVSVHTKHMHTVARTRTRVCKLASTIIRTPTPTAPHASTAYANTHARTHARWRGVAHRCTRIHARRCMRAKALAALAYAQTRTRLRRPRRSRSRRGLKQSSSTTSARCYCIGEGCDGLSGGGAADVCARTCSWTIGRAGVTAARRQVEEADAWSCIAQVPLPGRFAAACHTP